MFTWDYAEKVRRDAAAKANVAALAGVCTPDELARIHALRELYRGTEVCAQFGLDARRLRYARWLVEHGRIGEGVEGV